MSQREIAVLGGVSKNTQLAYESGSSQIPLDYLIGLEAHGLDATYVVSGMRTSEFLKGGGRNSEQAAGIKAAPDDLVEIAQIDTSYGLGAVIMDEVATPEMRTFSRAWLRQITSSPPEELYWGRGRGNSMAETINDGDPLLIDRGQQSVRDTDLIWAFAVGDVGAIKRLRPVPDGNVRILSDNPAVPPDSAHGSEIHIFGRVIAVVKKL